jgi:hypothetical protein
MYLRHIEHFWALRDSVTRTENPGVGVHYPLSTISFAAKHRNPALGSAFVLRVYEAYDGL